MFAISNVIFDAVLDKFDLTLPTVSKLECGVYDLIDLYIQFDLRGICHMCSNPDFVFVCVCGFQSDCISSSLLVLL